MVPVTIAYFSNPGQHKSSGMRRALLFGAGIIGTFTVLGLALAAIFGASGLNRFASDPGVNITLAVLFLVFAANLFGWLELSLPWRVVNAADRAAREAPQGSPLGALVMGATFTLTSVTCTAPFVGTLLVLAAQGSWATPVVGMIVYSTAFALPFVLLAIAPGYVARLPKSGEWIRTLRILIGLLEVGAAIKFVSNTDMVLGWGIFTRQTVLFLWMLLAIGGAVYLGRGLRGRLERRELSVTRLIPIAIALGIAAWLASGLNGKPLPQVEAFLPPSAPVAALSIGGASAPTWMLNDYPGALTAAKLDIPIAHVEAGLRSFDRAMPEEQNRVVTDHLSTLRLCPTPTAVENLAREGIRDGVHLVGDVMFDACLMFGPVAARRDPAATFGLEVGTYVLVTVHRAAATDTRAALDALVSVLKAIDGPAIFPIHPRTRAKLVDARLIETVAAIPGLALVPPVGYLDFMSLLVNARAVLTDSGGVQKEAYFHGIPCVTVRDTTEWVETVSGGFNQLTGMRSEDVRRALTSPAVPAERPNYYGDGDAAGRIAQTIVELTDPS